MPVIELSNKSLPLLTAPSFFGDSAQFLAAYLIQEVRDSLADGTTSQVPAVV